MIALIDVYYSPARLFAVFPFECDGTPYEETALKVARDMARPGIVCRDLKPEHLSKLEACQLSDCCCRHCRPDLFERKARTERRGRR